MSGDEIDSVVSLFIFVHSFSPGLTSVQIDAFGGRKILVTRVFII